jgi:hypothetical protein
MKIPYRFLPLGILPAALALAVLAAGAIRHAGPPAPLAQGYQSFVGVLMLLLQF